MALSPVPGAKAISERVHIRIRTDAGITKEIPSAADGFAPLDDGDALIRAARTQIVGRRNAGKSGADDQHVHIFGHELLPLPQCNRVHHTTSAAGELGGFRR